MSDLTTRTGQALRSLTHHRAAGPVLGVLAILQCSIRHSSGSWDPAAVTLLESSLWLLRSAGSL